MEKKRENRIQCSVEEKKLFKSLVSDVPTRDSEQHGPCARTCCHAARTQLHA